MNTPNPIDYQHPPSKRLRRRGSAGAFAGGLAAGVFLSVAFWLPAMFVLGTIGHPEVSLVIAALLIISIKVALGMAIDRDFSRAGFLPGLLSTIALVPLTCFGAVAMTCGGIRL